MAKKADKKETVKEVVEEPKKEVVEEKETVSESGKFRRVMRNGAWILKDEDGNIVAEE